jgi:hypothetical protein
MTNRTLSRYEGTSSCELGDPWALYLEDVSVAANHHVLTTLEKFLAAYNVTLNGAIWL